MTTSDPIRSALERLVARADEFAADGFVVLPEDFAAARAALAVAEPGDAQMIEPTDRATLAEPAWDVRYEFSVVDGDHVEQAGGSAPTFEQALSEGKRYLAQYQQDGSHTLEICRVEMLISEALREVIEVLADLRYSAHRYRDRGFFTDARRCTRAADLIERLASPLPGGEAKT